MPEVAVVHFVAKRISVHEMMLKRLINGVKASKITLIYFDAISCDFLDIECVWRGIGDIFCVNTNMCWMLKSHDLYSVWISVAGSSCEVGRLLSRKDNMNQSPLNQLEIPEIDCRQ
jgi:hypothetical protein